MPGTGVHINEVIRYPFGYGMEEDVPMMIVISMRSWLLT